MLHNYRSSRPSRRPPLEHNDSLSSAEEDEDDDDGFEILTAESLFSTLLSRVSLILKQNSDMVLSFTIVCLCYHCQYCNWFI